MIAAVLLFSSLNFSNLSPKLDVSKIIESANASAGFEITQDSVFAQPSLMFKPGQVVYVRIVTDNEGGDKHSLNVHDSDYNLLSTYQLSRSGNQFTVSFPAPQMAGTYSLEADIKSDGSVLNLVKTITVGGGGSGLGVKIENKVDSNTEDFDEGSPVSTPPVSPSPKPDEKHAKVNIISAVWEVIFGFFKKIF